MTRLVLILLLSLSGLLLGTSAHPVASAKAPAVYVYICNSKEAVAYHSADDCRGSHPTLSDTKPFEYSKW